MTGIAKSPTIDRRITAWMADNGVWLMRLALGVVFLWSGAPKLVPGLSPAESLAGRTVEVLSAGLVPAAAAVPLLACGSRSSARAC